MATINIVVTVNNPGSGNKYYLDGVLQATYAATPGNTYKFDQSDGTNSGHPLRLSITSDGTHNSGSAYTTGVTTNGTPGSAGAYTQIEVTATTVQALYYYCTAHSGMGGSFNVGSSSTVKLKDIKGFTVQTLSSDPTTTDSVGQFYYNSTSTTFKYVQPGGATAGTWASGGNLNTARNGAAASKNGTQNASLAFGGEGGVKNESESYDGTSWTEGNNLNTARSVMGGAGTLTAAIGAGGNPGGGSVTDATEQYNGTSWSEITEINTARFSLQGSGLQTAALMFTGFYPGPTYTTLNESWNGSSWTELADTNTGRSSGAGFGLTNTAAIIAGGEPGTIADVESWNGSSWTEVNNLNTARLASGGAGSSTNGLVFGGAPNPKAQTESWDGTSWTEVADLAQARNTLGGAGTASAALAIGGAIPPNSALTEEFTAPDVVTKTVTTS